VLQFYRHVNVGSRVGWKLCQSQIIIRNTGINEGIAKMGNGLDLVEGIGQLYNFRKKTSDLMAIGEETLWKK